MTDSRRHAILAAIPLTAVLCAIAGAVDIIAYLLFGKVFIANMTGNTVLFAASVIARDWSQAGLRIGVVLSFLTAISITQAVLPPITAGNEVSRRLITLAVEFIVLTTLALIAPSGALRVALLIVLAFALGMQNNAFRRIGPVKLSTAFITGDLENLGEAIADSEKPGKRTDAHLRTAVFLTTWVAYASGALLGAYGARHFAEKAQWIPAGLVVLAALLVLCSPARLFEMSPSN